jgi:hypothetical protein
MTVEEAGTSGATYIAPNEIEAVTRRRPQRCGS